MFEFLKKKIIEEREIDETLYEIVTEEVDSGLIFKGLYSKAFAESDGDENRAKAKYLIYRVQSIKDEMALSKMYLEDIEKPTLKDYIFSLIKSKDSQNIKNKDFDYGNNQIKELFDKKRNGTITTFEESRLKYLIDFEKNRMK